MAGIFDAAGATPWGAIGQTALGLGQAIIGGINTRKAQKQLERLQTPTYTKSQSIMDYYNKALQMYNVNPYQSNQYQADIQQGQRNQAAGIGALQNRASAVGGIARMTALSNENALNAGLNAEKEQSRRFGELGNAAQMRSAEDKMAFQYNQLAPYEKQYNLLAARAGANANTVNSGISNIFGGFKSAQDYGNLNKLYSLQSNDTQKTNAYLANIIKLIGTGQ